MTGHFASSATDSLNSLLLSNLAITGLAKTLVVVVVVVVVFLGSASTAQTSAFKRERTIGGGSFVSATLAQAGWLRRAYMY